MASGQHPWDWRLSTSGPDRPREGIWSGRNWGTLESMVLSVKSWVLVNEAVLTQLHGCCYVPLVQLQLVVCRYWVSAVVLAAVSQSPPASALDWLLDWLRCRSLDCVCLEAGCVYMKDTQELKCLTFLSTSMDYMKRWSTSMYTFPTHTWG